MWLPSTSKPPDPLAAPVPAEDDPSPQVIVAVNWAAEAYELASVKTPIEPLNDDPAVGRGRLASMAAESAASATLAVELIVIEEPAVSPSETATGYVPYC